MINKALVCTVCMILVAGTVQADSISKIERKRSAAAEGNVIAQYELAQKYASGQGVAQSYPEALKWYKLAADLGLADAQNKLGEMYEKGQGVRVNYTEALKWYRLSAGQGNSSAQNNLGAMYEKARGIAQSYTEALKWYQSSATQGHPAGQCNLGMLYEKGQGVTQNFEEAFKWYRLSAEVRELFKIYIKPSNGTRNQPIRDMHLVNAILVLCMLMVKELVKNLIRR